jgi:hypothetical protein
VEPRQSSINNCMIHTKHLTNLTMSSPCSTIPTARHNSASDNIQFKRLSLNSLFLRYTSQYFCNDLYFSYMSFNLVRACLEDGLYKPSTLLQIDWGPPWPSG